MDCELGAAQACVNGVTSGTNTKFASSWDLWLEFLHRIEHYHDPYLDALEPPDRLRVCGAFLHARRRGDLGGIRSAKQVIASTAKTTLNHVAATFVSSAREDPALDSRGRRHEHLRRQVSAYQRTDPPVKHQKAIPPVVFRYVINNASHPRAKARGQLLAGALLFALQSCEYLFILHRPGREENPGNRGPRHCIHGGSHSNSALPPTPPLVRSGHDQFWRPEVTDPF